MCIFASVADSSDIFQAFYLEEKWPNANAGQTEAQIGMEYDIVRRQVRFNNNHYKIAIILNCGDITVILSVACVLYINFRHETLNQINILYVEVIMEYFSGIFIPMYLLICKKAIRSRGGPSFKL